MTAAKVEKKKKKKKKKKVIDTAKGVGEEKSIANERLLLYIFCPLSSRSVDGVSVHYNIRCLYQQETGIVVKAAKAVTIKKKKKKGQAFTSADAVLNDTEACGGSRWKWWAGKEIIIKLFTTPEPNSLVEDLFKPL